MKSPLWRAVALISLSLLMSTLMLEDAQAARRSGLAGNLQITDPDDVNIFPHHNVRYRDRMTIDMGGETRYGGPSDSTGAFLGSATLIFGGEKWAFNASASRSDFLNGLSAGFWGGNDRGLFGPRVTLDPSGPSTSSPFSMQWLDLGFAYALSSSELGVRLGWGRDATTTTTTPDATPATEQDQFANVFHIQASWGNENLDVGGEVSIGDSGFTNTVPDPDVDLSGSYTQWALGVRWYHELGGFEWCVLGTVANGSSDAEFNTAPITKDENSFTSWQIGVGPVWRNAPETWQVAAQIVAGNQAQNFKSENGTPGTPDDDSDIDNGWMMFPGFIGSMEYVHGRWAFRGGVRSDYTFVVVTDNGAGTQAQTEANSREYNFAWTAGASVAIGDNFLIDMAFNELKVLEGPSFLGADSGEHLFAMLSATLNWGGGASPR